MSCFDVKLKETEGQRGRAGCKCGCSGGAGVGSGSGILDKDLNKKIFRPKIKILGNRNVSVAYLLRHFY